MRTYIFTYEVYQGRIRSNGIEFKCETDASYYEVLKHYASLIKKNWMHFDLDLTRKGIKGFNRKWKMEVI